MTTICPRCHAKDDFKTVEIEKGDSGISILFWGGLLPYVIHTASQRNKVQCKHCDFIFSPKTPRSKIDFIIGFVVLVAISIVIAFLVYYGLQ